MPTPLDLPFATQTDASGNAKIAQEIRAAAYTVVYATGQCNGSGQWIFGKGGNAFQFQQGANVVLGPIFLSPGQKAELQVVGASAAVPMTGSFWGFQGDARDGSDLVALAASVESAGSLSGSVALSLLGNVPVVNGPGTNLATRQDQVDLTALVGVTVPQNGTVQNVGTFTLPTGTHAVLVAWKASQVIQSLQVTGQTTLVDWAANVSIPLFGGLNNKAIIIVARPDTSVQIQVQFASGPGNATVWATAILDTLGVAVNASQSITAQLTSSSTLGQTVETLLGRNANPDLGVTQIGANPAPWQAPTSSATIDFALGGSATQTVIAAPGLSLRLYIHHIDYEFDISAATTAIWQDSVPTVKLTTDQFNVDLGGTAGGGRRWFCGGVPLTVNAALQLLNQTATAGPHLRGEVTYSVGV